METLEKLDMSKKMDRLKFTRRIMQDNYTHIDDCNCAIALSQMVDELQARAETAEQDLITEKEMCRIEREKSLFQFRRANSLEQERDTLAARVKELEAGLRDMQSMGMHSVYTVLDQARRILEGKR